MAEGRRQRIERDLAAARAMGLLVAADGATGAQDPPASGSGTHIARVGIPDGWPPSRTGSPGDTGDAGDSADDPDEVKDASQGAAAHETGTSTVTWLSVEFPADYPFRPFRVEGEDVVGKYEWTPRQDLASVLTRVFAVLAPPIAALDEHLVEGGALYVGLGCGGCSHAQRLPRPVQALLEQGRFVTIVIVDQYLNLHNSSLAVATKPEYAIVLLQAGLVAEDLPALRALMRAARKLQCEVLLADERGANFGGAPYPLYERLAGAKSGSGSVKKASKTKASKTKASKTKAGPKSRAKSRARAKSKAESTQRPKEGEGEGEDEGEVKDGDENEGVAFTAVTGISSKMWPSTHPVCLAAVRDMLALMLHENASDITEEELLTSCEGAAATHLRNMRQLADVHDNRLALLSCEWNRIDRSSLLRFRTLLRKLQASGSNR